MPPGKRSPRAGFKKPCPGAFNAQIFKALCPLSPLEILRSRTYFKMKLCNAQVYL